MPAPACTICGDRGYISWHPHWDNGNEPCICRRGPVLFQPPPGEAATIGPTECNRLGLALCAMADARIAKIQADQLAPEMLNRAATEARACLTVSRILLEASHTAA